ncbi:MULTISPECIES: sensor histidine kinase [Streptomyces]|uniref:histidine kinase n=2 Tax=Streptomyces TaxID=1883 RepID=A0A1E7K1B6_9ACTN|nr:sensor histidine kinase [Streptomyces qinglanensis]OEU97737.1 ATPase [Streptomyces qinglanensis]OEV23306.1 ATPase [Streptomyces nanshensis]
MRTLRRRWFRVTVGVLCGALSALAELVLVLAGGLWSLAVSGGRTGTGPPRGVAVTAGRLADWERRRMSAWYGTDPAVPAGGSAAFAYLAARCGVGLLGGVVLLAAAVGAGYASFLAWGWFVLAEIEYPATVLLSALGGLFLLFLCAQGLHGVASLDAHLARRFAGGSEHEVLQRRIGELAASRAGVVEAVHDERRRIERDLHDGVQQRLVALGMLLGRARRDTDPARARELVLQAHAESQQALTELREVAWRVYPAVLDEDGLPEALETVAARAGIPVRLSARVGDGLPRTVRTVAYFVVAECVTNAVKHSGASSASVHVEQRGDGLEVRVEDDGRGGADPSGGGLLGLARRVAALDGHLTVHSPAGGPTRITAELPCD